MLGKQRILKPEALADVAAYLFSYYPFVYLHLPIMFETVWRRIATLILYEQSRCEFDRLNINIPKKAM